MPEKSERLGNFRRPGPGELVILLVWRLQPHTFGIPEVLKDRVDNKVYQGAGSQQGCVRCGNGYHCELECCRREWDVLSTRKLVDEERWCSHPYI